MGINFYGRTYDELSNLGVVFKYSEDSEWKEYEFEYKIPYDIYAPASDCDINDMDAWCTENLSGMFKHNWSESSFELAIDAMAFKLAWT